MSGFVANESDVATEALLNSHSFFPVIDPAKFRLATRQDKTVTTERLNEALKEAIASANRDLAQWQRARIAEGYATLAAIPAANIVDESVLIHHYRRAVYCFAKAELLERYQDFDTTNSGLQRAQEVSGEEHIYRRDARWAISDLQGKSRSTVELI